MGRQSSLRSKAVHFVSDLTTVLLNPISDHHIPTSKSSPLHHQRPPPISVDDGGDESGKRLEEEEEEEEVGDEGLGKGPDTSSFTAFLYSLLSPSGDREEGNVEWNDGDGEGGNDSVGGAGNVKNNNEKESGSENNGEVDREQGKKAIEDKHEEVLLVELPEMSEASMLLSEDSRSALYVSLPSLAKGRKWVLLYSTWRHGISLSTLYRRSHLCPGLSLLVVGDRNGATFGGLVETPLTPNKSRKYQGTNNTFVFTDLPGNPLVFRPTGVNRYFTLCTTDFLAVGGGGHFALYLDSDLLNGSSSASDTYGNPCLANTRDFEVKGVELWGFVYASKYEEVLALSHSESHGLSGW